MDEHAFRNIVQKEWWSLPEKFASRVENVALLVEDEPSEEVRKEEGLEGDDTLLGHYHGVPQTARGSEYGVGGTLPDTITLYRLPLMEEAVDTRKEGESEEEAVARVIRETIWHEVGHYFGLDEEPINRREDEGTNHY